MDEPDRVARPTGATRPISAPAWGLLRALGLSLGGWAVLAPLDAILIAAARDGAGLGVWLLAWLRAAWLGATLAFALGVALAPLWVWDGPGKQTWPVRLRAFAFEGEPSVQRARVAALLAALLGLLVWAGLGYLGAERLIENMVQPHFAAAACVAWVLALAFPCALLAVALQARLRQALDALAVRRAQASRGRLDGAVRLLSAALASVGRLFAILAASALALAAAVSALAWDIVRHLPWNRLGPLGIALAAAALLGVLGHRRAPVMPRRRVLIALGAAWLAAGCAALFVPERSSAELAREHSTLGAAGYRAAQLLLDFDRDGHLNVLGGGDCAAFARRVHPGALETPQNGIDEDCNGSDLDADELLFGGRYDYPLPQSIASRPPIYLITVDAFAAERMRAPGVMPVLTRWAEQARDFRAAFSQGPSTRLSFPSIFTSRLDSEIAHGPPKGKPPFSIESGQPMLGELLHDAGYQTHAVVPVEYFMPKRWKGLTRGFDSVTYARKGRPKLRHTSGQVTEAAFELMDQFGGDRPPFLWVHYFDAHAPHDPPEGSEVQGDGDPAIYDAELRFVDRHLGQLLERIASQHGDQALVIVTGDHGWAADEPRHSVKHYGYDLHTPTLHVPLLVRAPFVRPGIHDGLVSTLDVLPTLANLTRMPPGLVFRGASLVPELLEGVTVRPQWLVHEFYLPEKLARREDPLAMISLRTPRYDLILEREAGRSLLYDWRDDYEERQNLAERAKHKRTRATLEGQLQMLLFSLAETAAAKR